MSIDISLVCPHCKTAVFDANITHNLAAMARASELEDPVWYPESLVDPEAFKVARDAVSLEVTTPQWHRFYEILKQIPPATASVLVAPLERGIAFMRVNEALCTTYNAPNGCGTYSDFLPWLERYLAACKEYPTTIVEVSR